MSEKALGPIKEQILPLKKQETQNFKGKLARFSVEVQEFRIKFQNNCPFPTFKIEAPRLLIRPTTPSCLNSIYNMRKFSDKKI